MNYIMTHIDNMEHEGWCDGCRCTADNCRKNYIDDNEKPECYLALLKLQGR